MTNYITQDGEVFTVLEVDYDSEMIKAVSDDGTELVFDCREVDWI